jgi:putative membrane protein
MGVKDHKNDISLFEKQARDGKDAHLKAFAEQTLPTLQKHLSVAQNLSKEEDRAQAGDTTSDKR